MVEVLGSLDFTGFPFFLFRRILFPDVSNPQTLRQWVHKYRLYGISAFEYRQGNASYSYEFKIMCVEAVLSGRGKIALTIPC